MCLALDEFFRDTAIMDHPRSSSANSEENGGGIPDDLRCKRSDGKQWRCTAMSMPDKTVCEKHYIQAKKRAANSALRASLKKAKRKSLGESDSYLESKSDDCDIPLVNMKVKEEQLFSVPSKRHKEKVPKSQSRYSPETPIRSLSGRNSQKLNDGSQRDFEFEENWRSYKTLPLSTMDSSKSKSQRRSDANAMTVSEIEIILTACFKMLLLLLCCSFMFCAVSFSSASICRY